MNVTSPPPLADMNGIWKVKLDLDRQFERIFMSDLNGGSLLSYSRRIFEFAFSSDALVVSSSIEERTSTDTASDCSDWKTTCGLQTASDGHCLLYSYSR